MAYPEGGFARQSVKSTQPAYLGFSIESPTPLGSPEAAAPAEASLVLSKIAESYVNQKNAKIFEAFKLHELEGWEWTEIADTLGYKSAESARAAVANFCRGVRKWLATLDLNLETALT